MSRLVLIAVVLTTGAIGCGGPPSQLDACKRFCEKQGECTNAAASVVSACKSQCDAMKATWSDNDQLIERTCSNADSVKQAIYDCYGDFCDMNLAQTCADNAAQTKCEPK